MSNREVRNQDINTKPMVNSWFKKHPEAFLRFDLVRNLLVSYYMGENHGYVNKAAERQYRFNETNNGFVSIVGGIKKCTVKFYGISKDSVHERFRNLHWKEASGLVEFSVSDTSLASDLDDLEDFLVESFHQIVNFCHHAVDKADGLIGDLVPDLEDGEQIRNEVRREVWCRTGAHAKFREKLLKKWHGKCALTGIGIGIEGLLVASHIKPWADSQEKEARWEQTYIDNGLILASPIDKLFDRGYLTFNDDGEVELHDAPHIRHLSDHVLSFFGLNRTDLPKLGSVQSLKLNSRQRGFLAYHRREVFLRQ